MATGTTTPAVTTVTKPNPNPTPPPVILPEPLSTLEADKGAYTRSYNLLFSCRYVMVC